MRAGLIAGWIVSGALCAQAPIERRPPQAPRDNTGLGAQAPASNRSEEPVQTIKVQTRLVNVALNAVDAQGAPVGGLQREDFEVSEDGKPQKIAVFERESATPLSIVLAIDASESVLRNEGLEKSAAKHFVKALVREQDEIDLMDFSDTVREIVPFTNQAKRIDAGLNSLQHGDATALYDAIYLAGQRLQSTSGANGRRRVIVLITDGTDTTKGSRYEQALEQAQRAGAMVYSLIVVTVYADAGRNTGGEHALIQMAEDTGGKYYYVEDPKDLEPALRRVSDDLRTQYLVGYYAPPREGDGSFRRIKIRMKDPILQGKVDLRYRTGYYADTP